MAGWQKISFQQRGDHRMWDVFRRLRQIILHKRYWNVGKTLEWLYHSSRELCWWIKTNFKKMFFSPFALGLIDRMLTMHGMASQKGAWQDSGLGSCQAHFIVVYICFFVLNHSRKFTKCSNLEAIIRTFGVTAELYDLLKKLTLSNLETHQLHCGIFTLTDFVSNYSNITLSLTWRIVTNVYRKF